MKSISQLILALVASLLLMGTIKAFASENKNGSVIILLVGEYQEFSAVQVEDGNLVLCPELAAYLTERLSGERESPVVRFVYGEDSHDVEFSFDQDRQLTARLVNSGRVLILKEKASLRQSSGAGQ